MAIPATTALKNILSKLTLQAILYLNLCSLVTLTFDLVTYKNCSIIDKRDMEIRIWFLCIFQFEVHA